MSILGWTHNEPVPLNAAIGSRRRREECQSPFLASRTIGDGGRSTVDSRADLRPQELLNLRRLLWVFAQVSQGFFTALAELHAFVRIPSPVAIDHSQFLGRIDQFARSINARSKENLELSLAEGRCYFVFDHFDPVLQPTITSSRLITFLRRMSSLTEQ